MKRGWLVVAATALMGVLVMSCGGSKSAEPDKVVGVLLKCTEPAYQGEDGLYHLYTDSTDSRPYVIPAQEHSGDWCQRVLDRATDKSKYVTGLNMRYAVTVRTSTGGSYTLEVPATTTVTVGQVWPPTQ